jgi:predicted oxidoreductase
MIEQGKSIKEVLQLQTRNFDKVDAYGRYLAEKGLRTAVTRRRKRTRNAPRK